MFLSYTRPRAELTRMYLPSKSNQTGVTCGLPFGMTVARLANAFFVVTRSRNSGGIVPRVATSRAAAALVAEPTHGLPTRDPEEPPLYPWARRKRPPPQVCARSADTVHRRGISPCRGSRSAHYLSNAWRGPEVCPDCPDHRSKPC